MYTDFIGREKEKELLKKYYESNRSEFVAVYGRRRVGKTFLINKSLDNIDFHFAGIFKGTTSDHMDYFYTEMQKKYKNEIIKRPKNWKLAFELLSDYLTSLNKNKVVVSGVNVVIKHVKPSAMNETGGRIEMEAPIHVSNVKVVTEDKKATKKETTKKVEEKKTTKKSTKKESGDK